ncbi:MAG: hypothetical protein JSS02_09860 [Planctomycetes bacterium]|nr:hypothetical protein [Planctomycetota bacterium]
MSAIHDTTEPDFTTHESLRDLEQIGYGSGKGRPRHNSPVVSPQQRDVLGPASQILHGRPKVKKKESAAAKRSRAS